MKGYIFFTSEHQDTIKRAEHEKSPESTLFLKNLEKLQTTYDGVGETKIIRTLLEDESRKRIKDCMIQLVDNETQRQGELSVSMNKKSQ